MQAVVYFCKRPGLLGIRPQPEADTSAFLMQRMLAESNGNNSGYSAINGGFENLTEIIAAISVLRPRKGGDFAK